MKEDGEVITIMEPPSRTLFKCGDDILDWDGLPVLPINYDDNDADS